MNIMELIRQSIVNTNAERPCEYLFLWKWLTPLLPLPTYVKREIKILDVGGAESNLAKTLAELGFDTTVIDINPVEHGKAKYIKANILQYEFPENTFDIILSISTIEHVGLKAYGQKVEDQEGDIKTIQKIYKWLKPDGISIITLPYGKPHHPPTFERVYNQETLTNRILIDKWEIIEMQYATNMNGWSYCTEAEAQDKDSVILLILKKP